jgi:hypothetical protein
MGLVRRVLSDVITPSRVRQAKVGWQVKSNTDPRVHFLLELCR